MLDPKSPAGNGVRLPCIPLHSLIVTQKRLTCATLRLPLHNLFAGDRTASNFVEAASLPPSGMTPQRRPAATPYAVGPLAWPFN
jgi:hypothetical protein